MNKKVWQVVCSWYPFWIAFISINVVLLALLLIVLPSLEKGSASYEIGLVTSGVFVFNIVVMSVSVYQCRQFLGR